MLALILSDIFKYTHHISQIDGYVAQFRYLTYNDVKKSLFSKQRKTPKVRMFSEVLIHKTKDGEMIEEIYNFHFDIDINNIDQIKTMLVAIKEDIDELFTKITLESSKEILQKHDIDNILSLDEEDLLIN